MPGVRCDGFECEALGDLRRCQGALHVLFVGHDENGGILQVLKRELKKTQVMNPVSVIGWHIKLKCFLWSPHDVNRNKATSAEH